MFRRFRSSMDGNIAVVTGLTLGVIVTGVGMAVDYSNIESTKTTLQDIVDTAALAGAGVAERSQGERMATVRASIRANSLSFEEDLSPQAIITFDEARDEVRVKLPYSQKLFFGGFLGKDKQDLAPEAAVSFTTSDVVPITISLALDSSGSMDETAGSGQKKIEVLRDAITLLFDEIELASDNPALLDRSLRTSLASYNVGVLASRDTAYGWRHMSPTVANLLAEGGTNSTPALQFTYDRILEDRDFRVRQERGYKRDRHKEFVLFMTDGDNNEVVFDQESSALCQQMRDEDILIYSVAFAAPDKGQLLLLDCASFNEDGAPDGGGNGNGDGNDRCENNGRNGNGRARGHCGREGEEPTIDELRELKSSYYFDAEDADAFRAAFAAIGRDISSKTIRVLR